MNLGKIWPNSLRGGLNLPVLGKYNFNQIKQAVNSIPHQIRGLAVGSLAFAFKTPASVKSLTSSLNRAININQESIPSDLSGALLNDNTYILYSSSDKFNPNDKIALLNNKELSLVDIKKIEKVPPFVAYSLLSSSLYSNQNIMSAFKMAEASVQSCLDFFGMNADQKLAYQSMIAPSSVYNHAGYLCLVLRSLSAENEKRGLLLEYAEKYLLDALNINSEAELDSESPLADPIILSNLGQVYYLKGEYDKALNCLHQASEFSQVQSAYTAIRLAAAHLKSGDKIKAKQIIEGTFSGSDKFDKNNPLSLRSVQENDPYFITVLGDMLRDLQSAGMIEIEEKYFRK